MNQHVKRIFYLSMTEPAQKRERTKRKDPLPILRCERRYPFLTENDTVRNSGSPSGALQLYFGLLPFAVKEEMDPQALRFFTVCAGKSGDRAGERGFFLPAL